MQNKPKNEVYHPQEAFLKKVLKMLKQLNHVNEENVKCIYGVVENDLGYCLPDKTKSSFFHFMKSINKVLKVLKTEGSHCSFLGLASNGSSYLIHFQKDPLGTNMISPLEYDKEKKCFINLNEAEFDEESQHLLNLHQAKGESKYIKVNYQSFTSGVHQVSSRYDGASMKKFSPGEEDYNLRGTTWNDEGVKKSVLTPNLIPLQNKTKENYAKNNHISDEEKAYQNVLRRLGNEYLHSEKAIEDYGLITYAEFFEQLIDEPDDPINSKWIDFFLGSISNKWSHPCLLAIKRYIREYPPF